MPEAVLLPIQEKEAIHHQLPNSFPATAHAQSRHRGWSDLTRRLQVIVITIDVLLAAVIVGTVVGVVVHKNETCVLPKAVQIMWYPKYESAVDLQHPLELLQRVLWPQ